MMTNARVIFSDGSRNWAHELDDLRERWMLRKENRTADEWMPVSLFAVDIKSKSKKELLTLHASLSELARDIDKAISEAKRRAIVTGVYADADWYSDSLFARKSISIHQQIIQLELHERPREPKKPRLKRLEKYRDLPNAFISIAKDTLPREVFDSIMLDAKRIIAEQDNQSEQGDRP